ncbi:MAG: DNA-directed RNA polymerase [Methanocellales archaeon]
MYKKMRLVDIVRVPPEKLGGEVESVVKETLQEKLEGAIDKTLGIFVAITEVLKIGEGRIIAGDGAVYYETEFEAIVYKPEIQEIVEGEVVEIVEFGAFVNIGPLDCLIHVSQIADDFISYDEKNARLVGKGGKHAIAVGDRVRARIVAVSLNERDPRDSKIGLTMRQVGMGKIEWLEEARKAEEKAKKEA